MDVLDEMSEGRLKRYFRATRKLNAPGLISHITQRSAGREPMFVEDDDFLYMMGLLKEISVSHSLNIFAVCLMPNHVHILMSPEEQNLYDVMRILFSRYVMRFNFKYERKGHLVGGPYRQAVCFDDSYLLAASLYIHLNPVKANLSANVSEYRWTSSRLFCDPDAPESFIDPSFVLTILSEDLSVARERYRMLLANAGGLSAGHVLEQEDAIERFRQKLTAVFPKLFTQVNRQNHSAAHAGKDLLSIDAMIEQIKAVKADAYQSVPESRNAKKYLIEQMLARGFTKVEISAQLGVSRKTVYNLLELP
jgi:putative transposase